MDTKISIVAINALVIKKQAISIYNVEQVIILLD